LTIVQKEGVYLFLNIGLDINNNVFEIRFDILKFTTQQID